MIGEMNDPGDHAEEYYNLGYDGIYEPKEKAIIFHCVGRGLKIPLLSENSFPSSVLNSYSKHAQNVRPSHHVLDLLAPPLTNQDSSLCEESTDKPQSNQNNQCDEIHSESSDLDVYMSDEDDGSDECDFRPSKTDCPVQNTIEKLFMPANLPCGLECSSSGNRLVVSKTDAAKNEKDDSVISDDEVFSNPSFSDYSGSDSEDFTSSTNNLNQTVSRVNKNSVNSLSSARGEKNIYLDENLSVASDSCQTSSVTEHQALPGSDDSNPSEAVCLEKKRHSTFAEERENSVSSNGSRDRISEMFSSSEESASDLLAEHFRTFQKYPRENLRINHPEEFPHLSSKREQKPRSKKCRVENLETLPTNQLNIKNIANLLLSPAETDTQETCVSVEESKKDPTPLNQGVLVIENLPQSCSKRDLTNFLQEFGEIKNVTLIPCYDKMTARITIDADMDWLISCLNGSPVFGAETEVLRCYQE